MRLAKEKEKSKEVKEQRLKLQEFSKRGDIVTVMTAFHKPLRYLYKYFAKIENTKLTNNFDKEVNTLDQHKFHKFCLYLKIIPHLLSAEDIVRLVKQVMREKIHVSIDSQYILYTDFEELLIRISLLVKNKIGDTEDKELNWQYSIDNSSAKVLEDLFSHMNIKPTDNKSTLDQKLNLHQLESRPKLNNSLKNVRYNSENRKSLDN